MGAEIYISFHISNFFKRKIKQRRQRHSPSVPGLDWVDRACWRPRCRRGRCSCPQPSCWTAAPPHRTSPPRPWTGSLCAGPRLGKKGISRRNGRRGYEKERRLDGGASDRGFCIVKQFWSKTVPNGGAFHFCLGHFGKEECWNVKGGVGVGKEKVSVVFSWSGWWGCSLQQLFFSGNSWELKLVTLMLRDGFAWNLNYTPPLNASCYFHGRMFPGLISRTCNSVFKQYNIFSSRQNVPQPITIGRTLGESYGIFKHLVFPARFLGRCVCLYQGDGTLGWTK